ncbi:MAG: alpha/beta hydrolase [Rhizobacter sp.]|nr:alpha/beta hydrolase [Chlorobiales bacterium]
MFFEKEKFIARRKAAFIICATVFMLLRDAQPASAQPAGTVRAAKDIRYATRSGSDAKLNSLDVYTLEGQAAAKPVVVFIHGGGWRIGDKQSGAKVKAESFAKAGYVFVSINYRLSPAVTHPAHIEDVAKALRWVHGNIATYGGDSSQIFVMGHSAGAHLAALIATDDRYLNAEGMSLKNLRGAILLDGGSYNMTAAIGKDERIADAFGSDKAAWKQASPVYNVSQGKNIPPFLIIYVATREATKRQSEQLAKALTDSGIKADVQPASNKTHATLNKELGLPNDPPTAQVYAFLKSLTNAVR